VISIAKAVEATKARAQSQAIFLTKAIVDYNQDSTLKRGDFSDFSRFQILEEKASVILNLIKLGYFQN